MQAGASVTTSIDMPLLRNGSNGEAVRFLQQLLIAYGFLSSDLLTGKFASKTEQAVRNFQGSYDLKADGIVGKQTWRQLGAVANIPR